MCAGNALAVLQVGEVVTRGSRFMDAAVGTVGGPVGRGSGSREEERLNDQGREKARQKNTLHRATRNCKVQTG